VVTEKDVNELLTNYTVKNFLDLTTAGEEFLDYRSKVLVSHMWIGILLGCIIVKKFKNHEDLMDFDFFKKQKILFGLGIINEEMNHELKILNKIRNTFAHEIDPIRDKIPNLIKQFKFYPKNPQYKEGDLIHNAMVDGGIAGMITGILTRYLAEILWETQSKDNNKKNS